MKYPVFINCRDRVSSLSQLITWLEKADCSSDIFLLDNASTYPPLLEYYKKTPHTVVQLNANIGHTSLWSEGILKRYCQPLGYYIYTDPDIVPIEECPYDVLDFFADILNQYVGAIKVGFGLKIDDLPNHYGNKNNVIRWERQFWKHEFKPGLFSASVDTTFAMNRIDHYSIAPAIRTDFPYLARHTDWYIDSTNLTEEERYYREHARQDIIHWNANTLPGFLR